jgi:hypothetical protein
MKFGKHGINGGLGFEFGLSLGSSSGALSFGKHYVRWHWSRKIRIFGVSDMQRAKQYGSHWRELTHRNKTWSNSPKFRMDRYRYVVLASTMKRRLLYIDKQFYLQERPFYLLSWVTSTVTNDELLAWSSFGKEWAKEL